MLNRAPRPTQIPPLSLILDDIGRPTPAAVAKTLGVSRRTVERWIARDQAPRAAMLALFWLTHWGASQIEAQAVNEAAMYAGLAACLKRENAALAHRILRLLETGDFGSANQPIVDAPRPGAEVLPFSAARRPTGA